MLSDYGGMAKWFGAYCDQEVRFSSAVKCKKGHQVLTSLLNQRRNYYYYNTAKLDLQLSSTEVRNGSLDSFRFSYEPPKNFKCFLRCLYQTNGWIDNKGEFRINVIRETLYESSLDPIIAKHLIRLCTNVG